MFVFCHHKVGTVLFLKVMSAIAQRLGLRLRAVYGLAGPVDRDADIIVFAHSLIAFDLDDYDYRGVHLIRDPRDVWVSGYIYHRRCVEKWCTNANLEPLHPIRFPQVPLSVQHRPEAWKASYLAGLNGRSYQQNLVALDRPEGLRFELDRYASWTIEAMTEWQPRPDAILEMPMETLSEDFDTAMHRILSHLGLDEAQLPLAMALAATEDVARMDDRRVEANPHIHSRKLSKWREFLTEDDLRLFDERHGGAIVQLGYNVPPFGLT